MKIEGDLVPIVHTLPNTSLSRFFTPLLLSCRLFSRLASLTVRLEQAIHISGSKQQNQSSCTAILLAGIAKRRLQCITIILAFGTNKNRIATEAVI